MFIILYSCLYALLNISLRRNTYYYITQHCLKCVGLIILNAWYGKFVSDISQKQEKAKVIDVTVPLQCLVKDSKLILTEASKAGLPGFYDPCVGEEKSLKLLYQFRGVMHQVISADTEPLRIPKQSHRIESES